MERPKPGPLAAHWMHDPSVVFLNHGSFGGMPRAVHEAQVAIQRRMEAETVRFFVEDLWPLMDEARRRLAAFLQCDWSCLAPVSNATTGVATVLRALADIGYFASGDEVLSNTHEYPACKNNLLRVSRQTGVTIIEAEIPFPIASPEEALNALVSRVTPKTKLVLVSHVTSPTGLVLPIERLCAELEPRGVRVLVDGAHAPGMIEDLNLDRIGASYYTGNCHKWICSPKGSAFLHARKDRKHEILPVVLSNNAERPRVDRDQFLTGFDYVGTSDYSAFLTIPFALTFMAGLVEGGWPSVMRANKSMTLRARDLLCREIGMTPPAPDSMIGSICTMILPPHSPALHERLMRRPSRQHDALWDNLNRKHGIQVPVWGLQGKPDRFLRIACQIYNDIGQYEYLAKCVKAELREERNLATGSDAT